MILTWMKYTGLFAISILGLFLVSATVLLVPTAILLHYWPDCNHPIKIAVVGVSILLLISTLVGFFLAMEEQ